MKPVRRLSPDHNNYYNFICKEVIRKCKQDKEQCLGSICIQVETAHDQKKGRMVYGAVRKITGKQSSRVRVVKYKKEATLTDQEKVKYRWHEQFTELHNPHSQPDVSVL